MNTVHELLQQAALDPDFDLCGQSKRLAKAVGWNTVLRSAFDVLSRKECEPHWGNAIHIVYYGSSQAHELPSSVHECVARLYHCIAVSPALDTPEMDNEVWSTVHDWLGKSYTSSWSPYDDPLVSALIARMNDQANQSQRTQGGQAT